MSVLGFIPARGGSKGIKRKNLVPLGGKALIDYSVEAGLASSAIDEVFLSSDDEEIIRHCQGLGLDVEYVRPAELATDEAGMAGALLHALDWLEERGRLPEEVVLLQPTSPLRTAGDIDAAHAAYKAGGAKTLVSVHRMIEHPFECVRRTDTGWRFLAEPSGPVCARQQYQGDFFFINGAIYILDVAHFRQTHCFVEPGLSALHEMERKKGVDIDEPDDIIRAEACLAQCLAETANKDA